MNFPAYIIIRDNNAVVDLNFFLQTISVPDKEHSRWAAYRIQELDLVEGKDYIRYKNGTWQRYLVSIATFKQMLRTGRGDAYRQARAVLKATVEQFDSEGISAPDNLIGFTFETFVVLESEELTPEQLSTVPVLLIEGRAGVYGHDLFRRISDAQPSALTEWMGDRIQKYQLEEGVDYVSFKGGCPGRPMRTKNFVINIYAAVTIAQGERKGRGRIIANYLTNFLQALLAKELPATAPLSELVGLHPISQESANELLASLLFTDRAAEQQPAEETLPPNFIPQLHPDNCNLVAVGSVTPEPWAADSMTTEEDALNVEPQVHRTPSAEEPTGSNSEPQTEPVTEHPKGFAEEKVTVEVLSIYDMLVNMANNNLQIAHTIHLAAVKMADLFRETQQTAETVSALVGIEQQAALAKMGLHRGTAPIPASTVRDKIRHAVSKRVAVTRETHEDLFKLIYRRLNYVYNINISDYPRLDNTETHLQLCERIGVLDQVWAIVDSDDFKAYSVRPAATAA